ncbi:MAG: DASH family cryptochrome [Halomonas sp.]|nr:DASH family cryptochrome [Halomonas sp.]MCC5883352.1 DASH family cryptochrome [Halomonas sp.]
MSVTLVWLRHDLRLGDNPLFQIDSTHEQLLCVYVLDQAWLIPESGLGVPRIGPARLRFLWESLIALRGELLKRGSDLLVRIGAPLDIVTDLVERYRVSQVRLRREAGDDEVQDGLCLAKSVGEGVEVWQADSGLLLSEETLPVPLGALPASFSAFRRRVEERLAISEALPAPVTLPPWPADAPRGLPPLAQVCSKAVAWTADARGEFHFAGGEAAGLSRLDHYMWESGAVARYRTTRNELRGADFSTRLSPWLAHGCLSARQVRDALRYWEASHGANESSKWVFYELLWRDYFHWAARQEGRALFGARLLPPLGEAFLAWREGRTGVPFIDAAMHELAATGWLSNRARQNAASFLIHDLGEDWRLGAAWFEHCLVDFDVASNWGNWRYVGGLGRDSRERRFDVIKQAEYYDPDGTYVACWEAAGRRADQWALGAGGAGQTAR